VTSAPGGPTARFAWLAVVALAISAALALWLFGNGGGSNGPPGIRMRSTATPEKRTPNRLIHEKSPYLLQHAYNPVDWYPWGEEAFAKARRENKPIFLSIGYSTCHWCHVMERESFENDSVAELLNRDFVAIKVDREERPDVDRVYMTSMQAMGMGGGWPLNAFLTPKLKPFYGGTYFPPRTVAGRIGMLELLPRIHDAWHTQRAQCEATGGQVWSALAASVAPAGEATAHDSLFRRCAAALEASCDDRHGGFGSAPKFPSVVNLDFLWRWWLDDPVRHARSREMALRQLDAMSAGGIHDHLGGGFHRYSTDAEWLVPHFEKMLYDQAQLANAYLEASRATGNEAYATTARDVLNYVARDLGAPEGGFYSAEDADSEGEEGRFYVWTPAEIDTELGAAEAPLFRDAYGVTADGNFEQGASILHLERPLEVIAKRHHLGAAECERRLAASRAALLSARDRRERPHRDDKVLAAWNGLMISAFARGARTLDDPALASRAVAAGEFAWSHLWDARSSELRRRWRDGQTAGAGQLDDYANLALGYLDLYEATFDPRWLSRSAELTTQMVARFADPADGALFESPAGDGAIGLRLKDEFDGAEIAGNSIAAEVLQRLGTLLDRPEWRMRAHAAFESYARRLSRQPVAMPRMLTAMRLESAPVRHIVIAGDPERADTRAMLREFNRRFLPDDEIIVTTPGPRAESLRALVPFAASLGEKDGHATAYVCIDYACRLPTTDPSVFARLLDERPHPKKENTQ
jgi:uncharacterized protein YyaL (SSP411 family)